MVRSPVAVLALALSLAFLAVPAGAQIKSCGTTIQLVFLNPDLQPGSDGLIHAQGQFFAQFQAIGEGADKIEVFGFSFSPVAVAGGEEVCDLPSAAWVTGAYIPNYRADLNPDDGFFIPLITPLVPDGQYNAAVHAYDANNNELARFWTLAVVDNCDGDTAARCDGDAAQNLAHDKTAPWPMILPGDGMPLEGHKLSIEYGEPIASHIVYLNGKDITTELVEWEGRVWDADLVPDYGPQGLGGGLPHCSAPPPAQECIKYGPAYEWTTRALTNDDVVRVEAVDAAGNKAVKDLHIGSGIAGGAISANIPVLNYKVDELQKQTAPGQSIFFSFEITNSGNEVGHPFAEAQVPAEWGCTSEAPCYEWQPKHVVVSPQRTEKQELVITPPAGTPHGLYQVNATLNYKAGAESKVLAQKLTVGVGDVEAANPAGSTSSSDAGAQKTPLPLPMVLAALGAALLLARRRRA